MLTISVLGSNKTSKYSFQNETLMDILRNNCQLETKDAIITEYIECIDGVCANDEYSWVYYVNGEPMNWGADSYVPNDDDEIIVVYTKV